MMWSQLTSSHLVSLDRHCSLMHVIRHHLPLVNSSISLHLAKSYHPLILLRRSTTPVGEPISSRGFSLSTSAVLRYIFNYAMRPWRTGCRRQKLTLFFAAINNNPQHSHFLGCLADFFSPAKTNSNNTLRSLFPISVAWTNHPSFFSVFYENKSLKVNSLSSSNNWTNKIDSHRQNHSTMKASKIIRPRWEKTQQCCHQTFAVKNI